MASSTRRAILTQLQATASSPSPEATRNQTTDSHHTTDAVTDASSASLASLSA